ncbi:hypothetical protein OSTOST_06441, partial [Ostertagia ostertagi]
MARYFKWLLAALLALVLLLAAVIFALHRWVGSDDFRQRVEREAGAALGVPVVVGSMTVDVWPLPAVAFGGLTVQSQPPVTLERLEVRPQWQALLRGELSVATLIIRKAVLPQRGIDAILLALQKKKQVAAAGQPSPAVPASTPATPATAQKLAPATTAAATPADELTWLPRRTILDDVTWVSDAGTSTAVEGEARLGADALPDSASLKLIRGNLQGLTAQLKRELLLHTPKDREGWIYRWSLVVNVGGGNITGK